MKSTLSSFIAALVSFRAFAAAVAIAVSPSGKVVFAPGASEILIAPNACDTVKFAASEAKEFLSKTIGAEVPVVTAPTPGRTALVLGANAWAGAAGVTTNGLVRDGYRIRAVSGRVYVVGIDDPKANVKKALAKGGIWTQNFEHATIFGTYEFLERFCGTRFYFPGELGTIVQAKAAVEVPAGTDIVDAPLFTVRRYSCYHGAWFDGTGSKPSDNSGYNLNWWRTRMETQYTPCCHGQNKFLYMERFAESHPEYFLLLPDGRRHNSPKITSPGHPGQICHTSAVWEEIYQDVKAYLTGQPPSSRGLKSWGVNCQRGTYVDIMPQDGMIKCSCEKCREYYKTQPQSGWASELIWRRTVDVANRLTAEGVPGKVTMMAYSACRRVPEGLKIPSNVEVMVAERGPWTVRDRKEHDRELAEIKAWHDLLGGRKVWTWTYVNKHAARDVPGIITSTPRCIGQFIKETIPYSFGSFLESETDRWLFNHLNYYVFGKVCWKGDVDVDALLDEYFRLMYGAAAPEMAKLFTDIEDVWLDRIAGATYDTPIGPMSRTPTKREMFTTVYSPEIVAGFDSLLDAASAKVAPGTLEARRVDLMRREVIGPLKAAIAEFRAKCEKADSCRIAAGKDPAHAIEVNEITTRAGKSGKAPVDTRVNVWRDGAFLNFVFDCEEPDMTQISLVEDRKNDDPDAWQDNGVELFLNPPGDRVQLLQFMLTSNGVFTDKRNGEVSWNSGAQAKAERTPRGWKGTIRIPVASLEGMKEGGFPMHFGRDRVTKNSCMHIMWGKPDLKGYGDIDEWGIVEL